MLPLNWLLDAVLEAEKSRLCFGGPYTHVSLSKYPMKVDVRLRGRGDNGPKHEPFTGSDIRRGFDVAPHMDQEEMVRLFSEVVGVVGGSDPVAGEWDFHIPSLLWLMVIGWLGENRFVGLARLLARLVPNMKGVFCTEFVADAFRRFSSQPLCVYADQERITRWQLGLSERGFKTRLRRLQDLWAGWGQATGVGVAADQAWENFQGLDSSYALETQSDEEKEGKFLVTVGYGVGQIPPHLVGLSELANSPSFATVVPSPGFP